MKHTDEIEFFDSDDIEVLNAKHINALSPDEKSALISAEARLKSSHIEKQRLMSMYTDEIKQSGKTLGFKHQKASTSKKEFIEKSQDPNYFKHLAGIKEYFESNENLIAFKNTGGLFNAGVCWWHSRLQRAALYLTTYRPNEPKCSKKEAKKIIRNLIKGKEVLEISGFNNFAEFSIEFKEEIQKYLNLWQLFDGVLLWQWINGLSGSYETTPEKLKKYMDEIYEEVAVRKRVAYVKLQIKGIDSHALLITEIEKTSNGQGYIFNFIDSNSPDSAFTTNYTYGQTYLHLYNKSVPYLQREDDIDKFLSAIDEYSTS
ncbi:hypothetical protein LRP52_16630 [Photobacterium sp. ZSDE20]|uniref:Uncharacterized protein n=1 Tax=Photobacterium pectinilyticum TaxID=2906793 RepID=A0ABT1N444_9GAMM|nr:hypothetical protein [Photobacterium sp. ZSDE20]MCQ1058887.1 hypothetical protein [Photobacterium sp. ZSDE20]MDD1823823.1 hypothetical protein [Photobacterium sp. ZSDE20]